MEPTNLNQDVIEQQAIVQRDRENYAVVPHFPGGIIDTESLRKIADVADKYGCKAVKLTSAQRIALIGFKKDELEQVWEDLGMAKGSAIGFCVRSVKICPGTTFCKRGKQDSVTLGLAIDSKHHGRPLPNKMKIGVSGCTNSCAESSVKDIGLIGTAHGYKISVGGNAGSQPRIGEIIYEGKSPEEAGKIVDEIIFLFQNAARRGQRLYKFIDAITREKFMAYLESEGDYRQKLLDEIKQANAV